MRYRELSASSEDRRLLERFFEELYLPEFPHPDERESLENMVRYLELKAAGWYGTNNYHILLAFDGDRLVGGSVSDFLAEANAGVIEFIVVAPACRGRGTGTALLQRTEAAIVSDAGRQRARAPDHFLAELEDPFKVSPRSAAVDAFARAVIWHRWGYRRLDFPYAQPALSAQQRPASHLMLLLKASDGRHRDMRADAPAAIPADVVRRIVHEYLRWAMRLPDPEQSPEYVTMAHHLDATDSVETLSLLAYVGRDPERSVSIREVVEGSDPDLAGVLSLYCQAFPPGPTTVEPDALAPGRERGRRADHVRHLWAIRSSPAAPVQGMASFFTLPGAGFGGYVALDRALRGTGWLRPLLARIEEQMVRDDRGARGWYIECDPLGSPPARFAAAGFREVAVTYRQPSLRPGHAAVPDATPRVHLMYKEFGRTYHDPLVTRHDLLAAVEWIFRVVYRIDDPRRHPLFRDLERQTVPWSESGVRWRHHAGGRPDRRAGPGA